MNKYTKSIARFIYRKATYIIALTAQNDSVRALSSKLLRFIIRSLPISVKEYADIAWAADMATLLHEGIAGTWIYRSHSFAKVLGSTKAISFIFPYYKKEDVIVNAIKSLKNQIYFNLKPSDIEIIVIDDGSQNLIDHLIDNDILYLRRNKFGYGISRSRNLGAKASSGRLLCFLDPDFIFPENYVETLYSKYLEYGRNSVISGYIYDYFYKGCEDPRVAFGVWEKPNIKTKRFLQLAGGHMAIDRNLFFNIGGFDEDLIYGEVEDTYFGYLLSQQPNVNIVFSTEVCVKHIPHPTGLAHATPYDSFRVVAFKNPEFYKTYVLEGKR